MRSSSLNPWTVQIDDKDYVVEKITLGDLEAICDHYYREEVSETNKKKFKTEKERINAINSVIKMSPDYCRFKLLETISFVIFYSLQKKQPEIKIEYVQGLVIDDEMIQLAYDILDIKRIIRDIKEVEEVVESMDESTKKNVS